MRKYDIHIHTDKSDCSDQSVDDVVRIAEKVGMDGIAITNHNQIADIEEARSISDNLHIISGTEVTTDSGDILGLFVDKYPDGNNPLEIVEHIHDQNGIAVIAHPFDPFRNSLNPEDEDLISAIDAVEVINSRCVRESYNQKAREFAKQRDMPMTAGSDAHFTFEIGRAFNLVSSKDQILDSPELRGHGRYVSGHIATKLKDLTS